MVDEHQDNVADFSASAPLAGYLFQCRLALLQGLRWAKKKPNGQISIEKFDDVSFENDDIAECLIQAKHNIIPKPLDDKSVDVWKTLRIWISHFHDGLLTSNSTKYLLITTSIASENSAMSLLRSGCTAAQRAEARDLLKAAAKDSSNQTTKKGRAAFLLLSDAEIDVLLSQVEVLDNHTNLIDVMEEIQGELILVAPNHLEQASAYLEGWWLSEVGERLLNSDGSSIPVQNIIVKANEIGKMFSPETLPIDEPNSINAHEYSAGDEAETFVKQMRAVEMPDTAIQRGAKDYYRAMAQRSKWARENLLLDGEASKYDECLVDVWERKFDEAIALGDVRTDDAKKQVGQQICFWAASKSIGFRNVVETWITSGSFQGLSDRVEIGWHPDFQAIFGEGASDGET